MSISYKIFCAFGLLVALACVLAFLGYRGASRSDDRVVRLYDGPLMAINHARSAHAALNEARLLMLSSQHGEAPGEAVAKFEKLLTTIAEDLDIVRERVQDDSVVAALRRAQGELREWSDTSLILPRSPPVGDTKDLTSFLLARKSETAVAALDDLVETVAAYGFDYRMEAEASGVASRHMMLAFATGIALTGLVLAVAFAYSISKPIFAAMHVAERVAAGIFTDRIETRRRDELGRLLQSLAVMQTSLKTRADEDTALVERIVFLAHHDLLTGLYQSAPVCRIAGRFHFAAGPAGRSILSARTRPRQVQGRQRYAWASDRRRASQVGRAAIAAVATRDRNTRTAWRRRVCDHSGCRSESTGVGD